MTSTPEIGTAPAAAAEEPKSAKKAGVGKRARNVAPSEAKAGKKGSPAESAQRREERPQALATASKAAKILDLLKRPGGATSKELQKASGWQPHSVRGFLSGTVGKKMGLTVTSTKGDDGERSYSLKA